MRSKYKNKKARRPQLSQESRGFQLMILYDVHSDATTK